MERTQYYVSPSAGSDATGDGSIGTPWKTTQWALDHITRDVTNGDQINIQAGGLDVLTAPLSLATYGAGVVTFSGYTAVADDGGNWTDCGLSGGGTSALTNLTTYAYFKDLRLTNAGSAGVPLVVPSGTCFYNCHIDTCAYNGYIITNSISTHVFGCLFEGFTGGTSVRLLSTSNIAVINGNTFRNFSGIAVRIAGTVINNIIDCSAVTAAAGISLDSNTKLVAGNVVYGVNNTSTAIRAGGNTNDARHSVFNNLIVGFSGVGGLGVHFTSYGALGGYNAFYNVTTKYNFPYWIAFDKRGEDIDLAADPFLDAANGDFRLTDVATAALRGQRFPQTWPGNSNMVDLGVIGAWAAGAGGGGGPVIGSRIIRGLGAV